MTVFRFLPHALANLADREIERAEVERALAEPDVVAQGHGGRQIYMRRYYDGVLNREMLLRVIIERDADDLVVITLYKTSQIDRYLNAGEAT